jgi:hypothetical protein
VEDIVTTDDLLQAIETLSLVYVLVFGYEFAGCFDKLIARIRFRARFVVDCDVIRYKVENTMHTFISAVATYDKVDNFTFLYHRRPNPRDLGGICDYLESLLDTITLSLLDQQNFYLPVVGMVSRIKKLGRIPAADGGGVGPSAVPGAHPRTKSPVNKPVKNELLCVHHTLNKLNITVAGKLCDPCTRGSLCTYKHLPDPSFPGTFTSATGKFIWDRIGKMRSITNNQPLYDAVKRKLAQ